MPVGHGWDVHRLVPGRRFVLGGVEIPHPCGPLGHSDGDVLLHAVIDALLGAAGLGDIGGRFPDTDPRWRQLAEIGRRLGLYSGGLHWGWDWPHFQLPGYTAGVLRASWGNNYLAFLQRSGVAVA